MRRPGLVLTPVQRFSQRGQLFPVTLAALQVVGRREAPRPVPGVYLRHELLEQNAGSPGRVDVWRKHDGAVINDGVCPDKERVACVDEFVKRSTQLLPGSGSSTARMGSLRRRSALGSSGGTSKYLTLMSGPPERCM